jgi:peptidoglycan hydrolase-like protein with peptidoglycan-binding domain
MQARLIELGYLRGRPNGLLNSATKKALAHFRKANNLPTPKRGIIIDPVTANALNKR